MVNCATPEGGEKRKLYNAFPRAMTLAYPMSSSIICFPTLEGPVRSAWTFKTSWQALSFLEALRTSGSGLVKVTQSGSSWETFLAAKSLAANFLLIALPSSIWRASSSEGIIAGWNYAQRLTTCFFSPGYYRYVCRHLGDRLSLKLSKDHHFAHVELSLWD